MPVETLIRNDAPIVLMWRHYKASEDFRNSFEWAENPEHRSGSLWAAFEAGWNAHHDCILSKLSTTVMAERIYDLLPPSTKIHLPREVWIGRIAKALQ